MFMVMFMVMFIISTAAVPQVPSFPSKKRFSPNDPRHHSLSMIVISPDHINFLHP